MSNPVRTLADYRDGDTISPAEYHALIGHAPSTLVRDIPGERFPRERDMQQWLVDVARTHGWLVYHTWSSKRSEPGFPDTWLVQPPHECVVELKLPGRAPTSEQGRWLDALARVRFRSAWQWVCLWYPEHEDAIATYLADPAQHEPPGLWVPGERP